MSDKSAKHIFRFSLRNGVPKFHLALTMLLAMCAKLFGFVRLQQVATIFGTSYHADIYLLYYQMIWFVEIVLINGALMPALIATSYRKENSNRLELLIDALVFGLFVTGIFGGALYLLLFFIAGHIFPNMKGPAITLLIELSLLGMFVPIFLGLANFFSTMNRLVANKSWYATSLLFINLGTLAGLVVPYYQLGSSDQAVKGGILGLYIGAIASILAQISVLPKEFRTKLLVAFKKRIRNLYSRSDRLFWISVVSFLSVSIVQELSVLTDLYFASRTGEGGVGVVGYASRLAMFINMIMVATPLILLEPRWSFAVGNTSNREYEYIINRDIGVILTVLLPPVVVLFWFSFLASEVVYNSNMMEEHFRKILNELISLYSISVFGFGVALILSRLIAMVHLSIWLLRISVFTLGSKIMLNIILVPIFGLKGLAFSTLVTLFMQNIFYCFVLHKNRINIFFTKNMISNLLVSGVLTVGIGYLARTFYPITGLVTKGEKFLFLAGTSFLLMVIVGALLRMSVLRR